MGVGLGGPFVLIDIFLALQRTTEVFLIQKCRNAQIGEQLRGKAGTEAPGASLISLKLGSSVRSEIRRRLSKKKLPPRAAKAKHAFRAFRYLQKSRNS